MQSKIVRCNSCYFFVGNVENEFDDNFFGRCFVNPPQLVKIEDGYHSVRPTVYINDLGCFKYHRRPFKSEE